MKMVKIRDYKIGLGNPCFIIAEVGVNHNGEMENAHRLIDAAARAGANAVKFQSFVTDELITPDAPKANYQIETTGEVGSQYRMLKALELTASQQAELKTYCEQVGIIYLCTPYEKNSVDMLDDLGVAAYKIASTDITNIPLLLYMARKKRPVILSTGMSNLGEIEQAVDTLRINGLEGKIIILQCTSEYPTPVQEVNLRAIKTIRRAFNCPVGFSDHTPGIGASPWAVAVGACVVEKHLTLDRKMSGPDHRASIEPDELSQLVETIRDVESALGDGVKKPTPSENPNKQLMQKSLVACEFIPKGQVIHPEYLTSKRPATGISPRMWNEVIGRRVARDVQAGEILDMSSIDWSDAP